MTNIKIIDNLEPEVGAMLQAMYSRSHQSIDARIDELGQDNDTLKASFGKYYIGYGHESIADCAVTTIYIEGVSLLAAKVIQDFPLYNGQESSTRYIDFSKQGWVDVYPQFGSLNKECLDFYLNSQAELFEHLAIEFPGDRADPKYIKTLQTKVFDILRGFLPGGMKTQLSWFVSLRQAYSRLVELYYHPLLEIRNLTIDIINQLTIKYPTTFNNIYVDIETKRDFYNSYSNLIFYNEIDDIDLDVFNKLESTVLSPTGWNNDVVKRNNRKMPIPRFLQFQSDMFFEFKLDYASARDLLRHRNGYIPLPILESRLGFNDWYLDQLSENLRSRAKLLLSKVKNCLDNSNLSKYDQQYYLPIGYNVPIVAKLSLSQIFYIIELRSSKTVHPTLRKVIHQIASIMINKYEINKYCNVFCDWDEVDNTLKRADQDIYLE